MKAAEETAMKRKVCALALVLALAMATLMPLAACTDETQGGSGNGPPASGPAAQPGTPGSTEGAPATEGAAGGAGALPSPTPSLLSPQGTDGTEGAADAPGDEPPLLSFEEAKALCGAWIDAHPDLTTYKVNWMSYESETPPPTFSLFGELYYEFNVSYLWDQTYSTGYSHTVLVHAGTGELASLFMSQVDGEFLTQTIVPLDDWYRGESAAPPQALLTADEAVARYNAWVDERSEDRAIFSLHRLYEYFYGMYEIFGEQYYHFYAEDDLLYWYNVLIHVNTGEMLFMMTSDGMFPETMIETLEDWVSDW